MQPIHDNIKYIKAQFPEKDPMRKKLEQMIEQEKLLSLRSLTFGEEH